MRFTFFGKEYSLFEPVQERSARGPRNYLYTDEGYGSAYIPFGRKRFDGEKTAGNLGSPENYIPDEHALRIRGHKANLTMDAVRTITGKFEKFAIGAGLKLQAEPKEAVLKLEGIQEDLRAFVANVEGYFTLWAGSKRADYSGMRTLNQLSSDCFIHGVIGGDNLVVLRVDDQLNLTVQLIDGQHVRQPLLNGEQMQAVKAAGNMILKGVEYDKTGRDVAYYVVKQDFKSLTPVFERIPAWIDAGGIPLRMAWLSGGKKHRIDHRRSISELTPILEKVAKLDRYAEATVSSAEERAKNPWFFEHGKYSTEENPLINSIRRKPASEAKESSWELAEATARNIMATEEKNVYNLPIDVQMKTLSSGSEVNYAPFSQAVFVEFAAGMDIPPEVARQMYGSNYSASRAAVKGWEHILKVKRTNHVLEFEDPIYEAWLFIHILKNKVSATGYLAARQAGNYDVVEAYSNARFTGSNMPHIDPKKEVDAVRAELGDLTTPLINYEQAAEKLNNGEWEENYKQYLDEYDLIDQSKQPGASQAAPTEEPVNDDDNAADDKDEE